MEVHTYLGRLVVKLHQNLLSTPLLCAVVAASSAVVACASPFQAKGFRGGYEDTALGPDLYRVEFQGNGYTRMSRAVDFAIWRAAELSLERGYSHFMVQFGNQSVASQLLQTAPPQYETNGVIQTRGNTSYYSANTTQVGGSSIVINRPDVELMVQMFHSDGAPPNAMDAAFVQSSMKKKYGY